jgi:hypothetical protein
MPRPKNSAGWRLLRTSDGTADTDWVGTVARPPEADRGSLEFGQDHEGVVTKISVVLIALDSSGDPIAPAGTATLELIEVIPRTGGDPVVVEDYVPVSRGTETSVPPGAVRSWAVSGMGEFTVRLSSPSSLPGSLDSLEFWYRVERT